MGGIIGMLISSLSKFKISKLVLNDIGPFVSAHSLVRLAKYCGHEPDFNDLQHAKEYFSEIYKPFGDLSDLQWEHIASSSVRPGDGYFFIWNFLFNFLIISFSLSHNKHHILNSLNYPNLLLYLKGNFHVAYDRKISIGLTVNATHFTFA